MTDQSAPDTPAEIDETAVEPETITNVVEDQDDVWVDDDQTPAAQEDTGITLEDEPDDDTDTPVETAEGFESADGSLTVAGDGTITAARITAGGAQ
jgi:hypothetical protein